MLLAKARLKHLQNIHTIKWYNDNVNKIQYIRDEQKNTSAKVHKMQLPRCNIQPCHHRIHPSHRNMHPSRCIQPQLYIGMLRLAVAGYIRYTGVSLGAVRTLMWFSFLFSDIISSRTF